MFNQQNLNKWIQFYKPVPQTSLRLFCLPYAGGGAAIYRSWSNMLLNDIEVIPIQLPGRENRYSETPYTDISKLIKDLSKALIPFYNKPFAFFGHSMGALICFELAREINREFSVSPQHLFVSGFSAPHIKSKIASIHNLPDHLFVEELSLLNGISIEILSNDSIMQILLPIIRSDLQMIDNYKFTFKDYTPLNCPISAFGGISDNAITKESLEEWKHFTNASFSIHMFPGDHFFVNTASSNIINYILLSLL